MYKFFPSRVTTGIGGKVGVSVGLQSFSLLSDFSRRLFTFNAVHLSSGKTGVTVGSAVGVTMGIAVGSAVGAIAGIGVGITVGVGVGVAVEAVDITGKLMLIFNSL
ncbi:MAG: hypothetical protein NTV00_05560, partial [Methylococcales bacterium]|nr:hypothetical protein [Methylococcales bacterium]